MTAHSSAGSRYPVAPKVVAATSAAAVGGFIIWALSTYVFHGVVPDAVQAVVNVAVPGLLALAAGWLAPHQQRDSDHSTGHSTAPVQAPTDSAPKRKRPTTAP